MKAVTDPAILAQLNGDGGGLAPVTDPAVLAQLNGTGTHKSQTLGFEQSVGGFLANAATPAIKAGEMLGIPMDWAKEGQQVIRNPEHAPNETPGGIGRFVGQVPAMVGLAPLGPLAGGAAMGALSSDKKTPLGVAGDAALGGIMGKGTDLALGALGKVISPQLSPAVQRLMAAKVPLTPGQTIGGLAKDFEDKAVSVPILGHMIKGAQTNSVEGFNRAVLNQALKPIGQALPANKAVGREGVEHVYDAISNSYNSILPQMTGVLDQPLQADINAIGQGAIGSGVKQDVLNRFNAVLKGQIIDRAQGGALTGDALKDAQQNLGNIARRMSSSQDADDQALGELVTDAQGAFNDMLTRHNPALATELKATNAAFAQYARIRRAASSVGSKDGVFSPPQYANAVKAMDKSAGKGAYARGAALNQGLSDAANQVLPSSVPNSGTMDRGLAAALPLLLTGGSAYSPMLAPAMAGAALYTKPGQVAARYALGGSRPAWAPAAASAVNAARLPLALLSSTAHPSLIQPQN
jgi:hypothetical protein